MTEEEDAIIEAEANIKAHRLRKFMRDPANHLLIKELSRQLIDEASNWTWDELSIEEQGVLAHMLWGITRNPSGCSLLDLRWALSLGYVLGRKNKASKDLEVTER